METNYIKFGNGNKILVIIPGMSINPIIENKAQIEAYFVLFKTNYTIYLVDRTYNPSPNYSCFDMAKDAYQLLKNMDINKASIYGVSQGGMIALALTYLYPNFVEKLVLASTYAKGNLYSANIFNTWIRLADENIDELAIHMIEHMYSKNTIALYKTEIYKNFTNVTKKQLENFKIFAKACIDFDILDKLKDIKKDVFVICAKNDLVLTSEGSYILKDKLHASFYEYDENYGHAVYDEASNFLQLVYDFLEN